MSDSSQHEDQTIEQNQGVESTEEAGQQGEVVGQFKPNRRRWKSICWNCLRSRRAQALGCAFLLRNRGRQMLSVVWRIALKVSRKKMTARNRSEFAAWIEGKSLSIQKML